MLSILSADLFADGLLNCSTNPPVEMSAALRRAQQCACEKSKLSISCTKSADEKRLVGKQREDFIDRCEGLPAASQKKSGR